MPNSVNNNHIRSGTLYFRYSGKYPWLGRLRNAVTVGQAATGNENDGDALKAFERCYGCDYIPRPITQKFISIWMIDREYEPVRGRQRFTSLAAKTGVQHRDQPELKFLFLGKR